MYMYMCMLFNFMSKYLALYVVERSFIASLATTTVPVIRIYICEGGDFRC